MSYGQNPYGQNPYGGQPQQPYGQRPFGGQPQQPNPYGRPPQHPYAQPPAHNPYAQPQQNPYAQPPGGQQSTDGWQTDQPPAAPESTASTPKPTLAHHVVPVHTLDEDPESFIAQSLGEVIGVALRPRTHDTTALTKARQEAVSRMAEMAKTADADAVVGLRFDSNAEEIVAYGTAVVLTDEVEPQDLEAADRPAFAVFPPKDGADGSGLAEADDVEPGTGAEAPGQGRPAYQHGGDEAADGITHPTDPQKGHRHWPFSGS